MKYLSQSTIGLALLACGLTTSAAGMQHHNNHHWNYGFQGAIGQLATDNQSIFESSATPEDFYSDYEQEGNRSSTQKTLGMLGAHIGYESKHGSCAWGLTFQANASAGYTEGEQLNDEATSNVVIQQRVKPKYQLNLLADWKHFITADTYFRVGAGISYLNAQDRLHIWSTDITTPDTHNITQKNTFHSLGAVVSAGVGYTLSPRSSIDVGINYAFYGNKGLESSQQLDILSEDDELYKPQYLRHRKTQISMMTLSVGYSHQF